MKKKLTRQEVSEMLPAYVLGALEPEQMQACESYLQHRADPTLLVRYRDLEEVVMQLLLALPDMPLPTSVKGRLMERVQADLSGISQELNLSPPADQPPLFSICRGNPLRLPWFLSSTRPLAWATVGALLVALLAGGGYVSQLNSFSQLQAQLEVVVRAERKVALLGTEGPSKSKGALFLGNEQGVLVLDQLPPLSSDETYQLWLIPTEGDPFSLGLINISDQATTYHTISLPANALEYVAVGLSQEKAGGSVTPTRVVMLGKRD